MMRAAVIDSTTQLVRNVIVADPARDPAPDGTYLLGLADETPAEIGWSYDPATGRFTDPAA